MSDRSAAAQPVPGPATSTFRATGNEPGWRLDLRGQELTFATAAGEVKTGVAVANTSSVPGVQRYSASVEGVPLAVLIEDRLCRDTMSGMPHPNRVEVDFGGRRFAGCGGEPAALLVGREWRVEDIGGARPIDGSRVTIAFGETGRVSGRASCNRYWTDYRLSGEGVAIAPAARTKMACEAPLLAQEERFLALLAGVQRFDIAPDGSLVLDADRGRVVARRTDGRRAGR